MKAFALSLILVLAFSAGNSQTTYYFRGGNPSSISIWFTTLSGTTNAPGFTSSGVWVIPSNVNAVVSQSFILGDNATNAPNGLNIQLVVNGSMTFNNGTSITLAAKNDAIVRFTVSGSVTFLGTSNQILSTANTSNSDIRFTTTSGATISTTNPNGVYGAPGSSIATFPTTTQGGINANLNANTNFVFNRVGNQTLNLPILITNPSFGSITLSGGGNSTKTFSAANFTLSGDLNIGSEVKASIPGTPPTSGVIVTQRLYLNWISETDKTGVKNGTYGATNTAENINTEYFSGSGYVSAQLASLPVTLSSFTAKQTTDNNVSLAWVTSSESVNKGFSIERQEESGGKFQSLGFIPSKAEGGSSQTTLAYSFKDVTAKKGTNMYRLVQEDLDGKKTYSEVRVVKLSSQSVSNVFPNPSNGAINISRTNDGKKMNLQILDQSGRVISQVNNITDANYRMNISQSGIYSIKMMYPESGEQSIQRIVIQK